jgi:hypothetical protein
MDYWTIGLSAYTRTARKVHRWSNLLQFHQAENRVRLEQQAGSPSSPRVLQVLHLRAASFDVSGCNTMSYEFISIVRNEEVVGSNPISSTKSQMLKAHSSTMNCSKRPGDCEARASVSPTVHSLCARVKSQARGGFNETKAMVYVPGYTLLVAPPRDYVCRAGTMRQP